MFPAAGKNMEVITNMIETTTLQPNYGHQFFNGLSSENDIEFTHNILKKIDQPTEVINSGYTRKSMQTSYSIATYESN